MRLPLLFRATLVTLALLLSGCADEPGPDHEAFVLPDLGPTSGAQPMLLLGPGNMPLKKPVIKQIKYHYYDCEGLVGDWFYKLLLAEINFLAQLEDLPPVSGKGCAVGIGLEDGRTEPRFTVHMFNSMKQANDCLGNMRCEMARNVALVPHRKNVLRSYFLSDFTASNQFHMHCLAPPKRWFKNISCEGINWNLGAGA